MASITRFEPGLQVTEEQHEVHQEDMLRLRYLNEFTHGVLYPGSYPNPEDPQQLELTPCMARELVLLAELIGWAPYLPIMLDMASRPNDGQNAYYSSSRGWSWQLGRIWGGFKALKILSSTTVVCLLDKIERKSLTWLWLLPCRAGYTTRLSATSRGIAKNGSFCCTGRLEKRQAVQRGVPSS